MSKNDKYQSLLVLPSAQPLRITNSRPRRVQPIKMTHKPQPAAPNSKPIKNSLLTFGLSLSLFGQPAFATNPEYGRVLFEKNCAVCHAQGRNLVKSDRTLDKTNINKYLEGGLSEENIAYQIY